MLSIYLFQALLYIYNYTRPYKRSRREPRICVTSFTTPVTLAPNIFRLQGRSSAATLTETEGARNSSQQQKQLYGKDVQRRIELSTQQCFGVSSGVWRVEWIQCFFPVS